MPSGQYEGRWPQRTALAVTYGAMAPNDRPPGTKDPEVPEADALEQSEPATPPPSEEEGPAPPPKVGFEVPEADAIEQSQEVPEEDDDWR